MAQIGPYIFPLEYHRPQKFEAWVAAELDEPTYAEEADDGSILWMYRDSDDDAQTPVGVVIDPYITLPRDEQLDERSVVDRDVMLPDGTVARLRDSRALAATHAA